MEEKNKKTAEERTKEKKPVKESKEEIGELPEGVDFKKFLGCGG